MGLRSKRDLKIRFVGADTLIMEAFRKKKIIRRRSPRRQFQKSVGVLHKGNFEIEESLEVGELGILLSSQRVYRVDDKIVVSFFLPEQGSCVFRGVVRYQREESPHLFGVEFENLDFHVRRKLRKFVAQKVYGESNKSE